MSADDGLEPLPASLARTWGNTETMEGRLMEGSVQGSTSHEPPIGGALYKHTARRGRWRVEAAGPKWVTFRSLDVMGSHGRWLTFKERREDWPNGWSRV